MATPGADVGTVSLSGPGKRRCGDAVSHVGGDAGFALALADGVGTRACDCVASEVAVASALAGLSSSLDRPGKAIEAAFNVANECVRDHGIGACRGMRSTLVVVLWTGGDRAWIGSVGDSRAYRLTRGVAEPELLTTDDVGMERVPASLRHLERTEGRPLFREGLTRSLGQAARLDVRVQEVALQPGESLVLATDGMWGAPRFQDVLASCDSLDLQGAFDRWSGLDRGDDASLIVLRRHPSSATDILETPAGPADRYASTMAVWAFLNDAVAAGDWDGVVAAATTARAQSLRFGLARLVVLADRIAAAPSADRRAFEAVLTLARFEQ